MAENPSVRVRGVSHSFGAGEGGKRVLFDNQLDLLPGEITIMTGPSGSGKTTLLTLVGALRSVQAGSVETLGHRLEAMDAAELVAVRREIGFIFQAHNLFESLSALENVSIGLELKVSDAVVRRERAVVMLERLGLGDRLAQKPQQLSGGQRQRVAIARALAHEPRLVLADEPTAALDIGTGREVVELLRRLASERGVTVLIVTHDGRILDVADRIVNMVDGRIVSNVHVPETLARCHFLLKCKLFEAHSPPLLAEFAQKLSVETYAAGEVLIRQGEVGDRFLIIRRGHVDVLDESHGERRKLVSLGPEGYFGETALLTGEPRNATVVATEPVEVLALGQADFRAAIARSKTFEEQLREALYSRK